MIGRSPSGSSGLGTVTVSGASRVPRPPASNTASIAVIWRLSERLS